MAARPKSKKSETLEIRITHQEKEAVKERAASEGMTVSAWIRSLIAKNLANSQGRSEQKSWINLLLAITRDPFKTTGALIAAAGSAILLTSTAQAEPISLGIEFEHRSPSLAPDGTPSQQTKRMTTDLLLEENNVMCFTSDPNISCVAGSIPEDAFVWFIEPRQTSDGIFVKLKLKKGDTLIAEPGLIIVQGETGGITIGGEDGSQFSFKIEAYDS